MPACRKKTPLKKDLSSVQTPVSTRIYKTCWLDKNTGFFCGGEKSENGYIYHTTDAGATWNAVYSNTGLSLYDILFVNDSVGYCCGEDMLILRTADKGLHWASTENKMNSDDFFNGTLYGIFGDEYLLFFAGGKNFNIGIINWIKDNTPSANWSGFKGLSNEMRCGIFFDAQYFLAMGYGTTYKNTGNTSTFEPSSVSGDFFTATSKVNNSLSFACGYNGGVYKLTRDESDKIVSHNRFFKKNRYFNGIAFANENKGWVCGNAGVFYETTDGEDFKQLDLGTKKDLLSLVINKNNEVIVSTSEGKLIKFKY